VLITQKLRLKKFANLLAYQSVELVVSTLQLWVVLWIFLPPNVSASPKLKSLLLFTKVLNNSRKQRMLPQQRLKRSEQSDQKRKRYVKSEALISI